MKAKGLFDEVSSKYLLDKFLTVNGKMDPVKVHLAGTEVLWIKCDLPNIVEKEAFAYILPLEASLQQLLSHPEVLKYVLNPAEQSTDGFLKDVCDGSFYKTHPLFSSDRQAIVLVLYFDDVTTSNVLGSKIHKFSMFYWTLCNIPPHLRSTLRAVNLYGIARTKDFRKFGAEKIMSVFLSTVRKLQNEGLKIVIRPGQERIFRGDLLFSPGDTPAAQLLGGFKEGAGGANRPCRRCDATKDSMQLHFVESAFTLRDKVSHEERVLTVTDGTITKQAAKHWSTEYCIVGRSIFSCLENFDPTKCLPQDFMHVVLIGILPLEIQEFLTYVVRERNLVTLKQSNPCISAHDYTHISRDKPSAVDDAHLDSSLRENAVQTLALGHVLPFLLRAKIEHDSDAVDRLNNLILLMQIWNLCLTFKFQLEDVALLEKMILKHHSVFKTVPGCETYSFSTFQVNCLNLVL